MQVGGFSNIASLSSPLGAPGGKQDSGSFLGATNNAADIYAQVYEPGGDYMMEDGIDMYA